MGFKSAVCVSQDIIWKMYCSSLLLMYLWQSLLICFRSLSCMSTNLWPTSCASDRFVWCRSMLIASLIQLALHLVQIPDFAIGRSPSPYHNWASSMLYGWCDVGGCSSFTNILLYNDSPIWSKDFELWFVSPMYFIPLLLYWVFVYLGPLEPVIYYEEACIKDKSDILCTSMFINRTIQKGMFTYKRRKRERESLSFYLWSDVIEEFHSRGITCYDYITELFDIVLLPWQWFLDSHSIIKASFTESPPWHIFS